MDAKGEAVFSLTSLADGDIVMIYCPQPPPLEVQQKINPSCTESIEREQKVINEMVSELLATSNIDQSNSLYSSPVEEEWGGSNVYQLQEAEYVDSLEITSPTYSQPNGLPT